MEMQVIDDLSAQLLKDVKKMPVIARILRGEATRADALRVYLGLKTYVSDVSQGYDDTTACARNEGRDEQYLGRLAKHSAEEAGHEILLYNDLDKLGANVQGNDVELPMKAHAFGKLVVDVGKHGSSVCLQTIGYLIEGLAPDLGLAIKTNLKAGGFPTEFLEKHVEVDTGSHCHEGRAFLEALNDPSDIEQVITIASLTVALYPLVFAEN